MMGLFGEPLVQAMFKVMSPLGGGLHVLPLNVIRLQYGFPPIGNNLKEVYCYGDYTVYPDVPELIPTHNLPHNHRDIGPVIWSPDLDLPTWWDELPEDRPLVYINLGSSGNAALLEPIVLALADLPVTIVAATAGRTSLEHYPDNVYLADFLPGAVRRARLYSMGERAHSGRCQLR